MRGVTGVDRMLLGNRGMKAGRRAARSQRRPPPQHSLLALVAGLADHPRRHQLGLPQGAHLVQHRPAHGRRAGGSAGPPSRLAGPSHTPGTDHSRPGRRRDDGEAPRRGSRAKALASGPPRAPASLIPVQQAPHSLINALLVELAPHAPHHAVNHFLVALHAQRGQVVVTHHLGVSTTAPRVGRATTQAAAWPRHA